MWGWGATGGVGLVLVLLVLAAAAAGAAIGVAATDRRGRRGPDLDPDDDPGRARRILDERLAAGEIDLATHERLRAVLDGDRTRAVDPDRGER